MPSSISNFKRRLRLPRLFFRKPSQLESVHGGPPLEYERPIPQLPWRGITVIVVLIVIAAASAWEFYCRSIGYGPTLNDNEHDNDGHPAPRHGRNRPLEFERRTAMDALGFSRLPEEHPRQTKALFKIGNR
jgi:hypothetical protein